MEILESKDTIMTRQIIKLEGLDITFEYTRVTDNTVPLTPITTGPSIVTFSYIEPMDPMNPGNYESLTRLSGSYNAAGNFTFNLTGSKSIFDLYAAIVAIQAYAKTVMLSFL